jgi:hypothetical protein
MISSLTCWRCDVRRARARFATLSSYCPRSQANAHYAERDVSALLISGTAVAEVTHPPAAGPGIGNPATTTPGARDQSPGKRQSNQADRTFALTASSGGLAEVDLANLATGDGVNLNTRIGTPVRAMVWSAWSSHEISIVAPTWSAMLCSRPSKSRSVASV